MEPMTLGSPVGSPAASQHAPPVTSPANTFIPSYLMGDIASPASSGGRVGTGGTSPNKATRQFSSSTVSTPTSPQPNKDPFFPSRLGQDKPGGPPTQGLMGIRGPPVLPQSPIPSYLASPFLDHTPGTPVMGMPAQGTPVTGYSTPLGPTSQSVYNNSNVFTPPRDHTSLLCHDSHITQDAIEDTWVTVYGFPAPAASYILTQFTQLGTITEHRNPGTGNWMHLKYQTKLQARKALSKNGKIFSGNIMIGVIPCTDKSVVGDKENVSTANISSIMSPHNTSLSGTPKASMRPLTQAYQTAHAEHEVLPKVNTPKKSDGLVARAMQHILGL